MAASRDLELPKRDGAAFGYPVKAGVRLFGRAIVALDPNGFAVPAGTPAAQVVVGLAAEHVDNRDGADGAQHVVALREVRGFDFPASPVDIGQQVYAIDDETITLTPDGGFLKVGVIIGIADGRTWVSVGA